MLNVSIPFLALLVGKHVKKEEPTDSLQATDFAQIVVQTARL